MQPDSEGATAGLTDHRFGNLSAALLIARGYRPYGNFVA
jgi:hypothetical protein